MRGTILAHVDGGVPNILLELPAAGVRAGSGFQQRKRLEVVRQHQPFTSGNIRK